LIATCVRLAAALRVPFALVQEIDSLKELLPFVARP